ncbi:MAG: hypothetical protein H6523_13125 [Mycolicibacterium sp.]|nr:hypothetical protein [Mycolicibacterium sp.]
MLTGVRLNAPAPLAAAIAATIAAAAGVPAPDFEGRWATINLPDGAVVGIAETPNALLPRCIELAVPDLAAALARIDAAVPDPLIGAAGCVCYIEGVPGFKIKLVGETPVATPRFRTDLTDAAETP